MWDVDNSTELMVLSHTLTCTCTYMQLAELRSIILAVREGTGSKSIVGAEHGCVGVCVCGLQQQHRVGVAVPHTHMHLHIHMQLTPFLWLAVPETCSVGPLLA